MGDTGSGFLDVPEIGPSPDQLQQLDDAIKTVTVECPAPQAKFAVPVEGVAEVYKFICTFLRSVGVYKFAAEWAASLVAAVLLVLNTMAAQVITIFAPAVTALAAEAIGLLDKLRKGLDPTIAGIAVEVLNELLGTSYTAAHLPTGGSVGDHIARAEAVGNLLHQQLTAEFVTAGDVTADKGRTAAHKMSGFLINFGTATGILAAIGGLLPQIRLDEIREIGEQVARNLGLGRMHRMVMKPLVNTLIATPYQWWFNTQFHPTQFKPGELVNPYTNNLMDSTHVFQALDLAGYSDDKKQQLVELHQKRLSLEDVAVLGRWKLWDFQTQLNYLVRLGYDSTLLGTVLNVFDLHRIDARYNKLIDKLESNVDAGHMAVEDAMAIIEKLPINGGEVDAIRQTFFTFQKTPHASLTFTEVEKAFEVGAMTLDDVTAWATRRGYQGDDLTNLLVITLLKFAKDTEAKAVAQFGYDAKVAKAKKAGTPIPPKPAILAG